MARRKNTKRIDPRYFLNETTYRDLDEQDKADPKVVQQLAKTFSQDPVIMAAVEKAAQDPKVQAAAAQGSEEAVQEIATDIMGSGTGVGAAVGLGASGIGALALAVAGAPAIAALGLASGPALMAIAALVKNKMQKK